MKHSKPSPPHYSSPFNKCTNHTVHVGSLEPQMRRKICNLWPSQHSQPPSFSPTQPQGNPGEMFTTNNPCSLKEVDCIWILFEPEERTGWQPRMNLWPLSDSWHWLTPWRASSSGLARLGQKKIDLSTCQRLGQMSLHGPCPTNIFTVKGEQ